MSQFSRFTNEKSIFLRINKKRVCKSTTSLGQGKHYHMYQGFHLEVLTKGIPREKNKVSLKRQHITIEGATKSNSIC